MVEFVNPRVPNPLRVVILASITEGWSQGTDQDRMELMLPRLKQMLDEWDDLGAKCLATVDDDLLMVGRPGSTRINWYLIYEVPSIDVLAEMLQRVRVPVDGVRLDHFVRMEARIGRPFFLLES